MKKSECPECNRSRWTRKEGPCLPCRGGNPKRAPRPKRIKKKRSGKVLPQKDEIAELAEEKP